VAVLPIMTALIGLLLGIGGLREFLVDGIWYGQLHPLLIGAAGALVSALLVLTAIAIWFRWSRWPRLATLAGALSIVVHLYGALPPARNVGLLAMALGVGIGIVLLTHARRRRQGALQLVER
jgi:ABC-type proline/glycine betaine transport system permease subunit